MKTVCVSGHRPEGLPWFKNGYNKKLHDEFLIKLEEYIRYCINSDFTHFIAGGALGIDTDFALLIIALKEKGESITLEIAIPCKVQSKYWNEEDKAVYDYILSKADKLTVLSEEYYPFCMQKRNEYMISSSDALLVCWNGVKKGGTYSTIKYAQKQNKNFLLIDLSSEAPNGGNQMLFFRNKVI